MTTFNGCSSKTEQKSMALIQVPQFYLKADASGHDVIEGTWQESKESFLPQSQAANTLPPLESHCSYHCNFIRACEWVSHSESDSSKPGTKTDCNQKKAPNQHEINLFVYMPGWQSHMLWPRQAATHSHTYHSYSWACQSWVERNNVIIGVENTPTAFPACCTWQQKGTKQGR